MLLRGNKVSDCFWQVKELMELIFLDEYLDYEDFIFKLMDFKNLEKVCNIQCFLEVLVQVVFFLSGICFNQVIYIFCVIGVM